MVVPPHHIILKSLPYCNSGSHVAGHRQHRLRPDRCGKQVCDTGIHTVEDLLGRRSGGQSEVEAIHQARLVQPREPPQRCLRLARSRLRFDDHQPLVQRGTVGGGLDGVGLRDVGEHFVQAGYDGAAHRIALFQYVQTYPLDGLRGGAARAVHVVIPRSVNVLEPEFVGANPVGQVAQAQKMMLKPRRRRQRTIAFIERLREPLPHQSTDAGHLLRWVQVAVASPQTRMLGTPAVQLQRRPVMRQRRHQQPANRFPTAVVPRLCGVPPPTQSFKEPLCRGTVVVGEHRRQVHGVASSARRPLVGWPVRRYPDLGLEPDVDLADVMQRGEHAEPRRRRAVDVVPACGMRQPSTDGRLHHERFKAGSHVRQVMLQQMDTLRGSAIRLSPEPVDVWS